MSSTTVRPLTIKSEAKLEQLHPLHKKLATATIPAHTDVCKRQMEATDAEIGTSCLSCMG